LEDASAGKPEAVALDQDGLDAISDAISDQLVADGRDAPGGDWSGRMDKTYKYNQSTLEVYLRGVQDRLAKLKPPIVLADADVRRLARADTKATVDKLRTDIDMAV
jgi:hypothetical protein